MLEVGLSGRRCANISGEVVLEPRDLAQRVVEAASDKQANDIVLLDTRSVASFADYFVICSAGSERQIETIAEEIEHDLRRQGVEPHHTEGKPDSGWVLLDYSGVIVHIFSPEEREYYNLDELWSKAATLLRIQ